MCCKYQPLLGSLFLVTKEGLQRQDQATHEKLTSGNTFFTGNSVWVITIGKCLSAKS